MFTPLALIPAAGVLWSRFNRDRRTMGRRRGVLRRVARLGFEWHRSALSLGLIGIAQIQLSLGFVPQIIREIRELQSFSLHP